MSSMSWPRAILFDLDGTLVHSAPDIAASLNRLLREEQLEEFTLEAVSKMVGGGIPKLIERALKARGVAADENRIDILASRFLAIYAPRATDKTQLFPGVRQVLEDYHGAGVRLAVCTNKPEAISRTILEALEVARLFGTVVGGDTLPVKKPDPAPLLAALGAFGCAPEHAVMVGDSAADADAGRAAGIPVILVTFGYTRTPVHELEHAGLVDAFAELPRAVRALAASHAPEHAAP